MVTCADPVPEDAAEPAPLPLYSGAACPDLVVGENTITTGGRTRTFILATPADIGTDEELPVLFLWHWLGGDAGDFLERGEVQIAIDQDRFIAVIPEAKGDLLEKWPYVDAGGSTARLDEELRFFDDMLACVAAQYAVKRHCVGSVGVSAGALWTAQLGGRRSTLLSSIVSLSGGTGYSFVRDWPGAEHKMPALVLWGGPDDSCLVRFDRASADLEAALFADGHFLLECIHNCGHSEPPFEPEGDVSKFSFAWRFVLDHPYWLNDGESPYLVGGLPPATTPEWCAIGPGRARMRTGGMCEDNGCAP
jgi:predicted esterase